MLFSISEIWDSKIKGNGHNMTNYGTNTVAHKGGYWRPICDPGILSQHAGRGIPSMHQHWVQSIYKYASWGCQLSGIKVCFNSTFNLIITKLESPIALGHCHNTSKFHENISIVLFTVDVSSTATYWLDTLNIVNYTSTFYHHYRYLEPAEQIRAFISAWLFIEKFLSLTNKFAKRHVQWMLYTAVI